MFESPLAHERTQLKGCVFSLAEAKRTNSNVWHIAFYSVYATKSCAMVLIGGNFVQPRRRSKLCCCAAQDFYEKRNGRWQFVKRKGQFCS